MVAPIYRRLPITEEQLVEFCQKHRIQRMSVFGSVLRDDFGPESDVDFLVEFAPQIKVGWRIVRMSDELSQLLGGRPVDLIDPTFLNHRLKASVLESAEPVYVEE